MFKKRLTMLSIPSTIIISLLLMLSIFAYTVNATTLKDQAAKTTKVTTINSKNLDETQKPGINVNGLDTASINIKITEVKSEKELASLLEEAKELGIDPTGLTSKKLKSIILQKIISSDENMKSLYEAKKLNSVGIVFLIAATVLNEPKTGINDQINDTTHSNELTNAAKYFEVKIVDLSEEDGWVEVNATLYNILQETKYEVETLAKELGIDITGLCINDAFTKVYGYEPSLERLKTITIEAKEKYGVDVTGLSEEEAVRKMKNSSKFLEEKNYLNSLAELDILKVDASKLGVDITGLSIEDARAKLKTASILSERKDYPEWATQIDASAKQLGIDITGLYLNEAALKLNAASKAAEQEYRLNLEKVAKELGVDITGLSINDAQKKIELAKTTKEQEESRVCLEKVAKEVGVDITGLSNVDASAMIDKGIEENQKKIKLEIENAAKEVGVDVTGLSYNEAWNKINNAKLQIGKSNEVDVVIQISP
jgi:predicted metalloenzyme YecM